MAMGFVDHLGLGQVIPNTKVFLIVSRQTVPTHCHLGVDFGVWKTTNLKIEKF